MKLINNHQISRKKMNDLITKILIFSFSSLAFIALFVMFGFLIKAAYPAYAKYGFFTMYFTANFSESGSWGIWSPLLVTLITAFLAILIAAPIALRAAYFIRFRMKRGRKTVRTIINILAGVPSVIFGIFALKSLQFITNLFIGQTSGNTILNGVFMLVIMVMPLLISLILNQLSILPKDLINSSIALGNTKTYVMYTTVKKAIRANVYVAIIVALGRAIGETMALSIILISNSPNPFSAGFGAFFQADFATLGVLIAKNMFTDHGRDPSPLFAAGLALFALIMLLVMIVTRISRHKRLKHQNPLWAKPWLKVKHQEIKVIRYWVMIWHFLLMPFKLIWFVLLWLFIKLNEFWHWLIYVVSFPLTYFFKPPRARGESYADYFIKVVQDKRSQISNQIRIGLEVLAITFILGMIGWIICDIFIIGMPQYKLSDWTYSNVINVIDELGNITTKAVPSLLLNPLIWTFVLILLTIVIALPFALGAALYLSEYAHDKKIGKILRFFLDSLGGTPSILFGIFGVIFFIQTLNLHGQAPFSLIAGTLTMVLVIIPTFTRAIEQVLVKIPESYRLASYALGASKTKTIFRVIFPQAIAGMVTGTILSMGRIMGETAPIFLTLGLTAVVTDIGILLPGHTLTTNILDIFINNKNGLNLSDQISLSYKIGSVALLATSLMILLAESIPVWSKGLTHFRKRINRWKSRNLVRGKKKAYRYITFSQMHSPTTLQINYYRKFPIALPSLKRPKLSWKSEAL